MPCDSTLVRCALICERLLLSPCLFEVWYAAWPPIASRLSNIISLNGSTVQYNSMS